MVEEDFLVLSGGVQTILTAHAASYSPVCVGDADRDPIEWVKKQLIDNNLLSADDVKEIEKSIRNEVGGLC